MPDGIHAEVVADSRCKDTGARVTTFLLTYHRFVHQELLTHRAFSRNSASSRAVPVAKTLRDVWRSPAVPVRFGAAKKGMQDGGPLSPPRTRACRRVWLAARLPAMACSWALGRLGLHKQISNRVLEPWQWMTCLVTATEWENFYRLRFHAEAQPEIRELAEAMLRAHAASVPDELGVGDWHLPFWRTEDETRLQKSLPFIVPPSRQAEVNTQRLKACVARAARTSYVNFYGADNPAADAELHDRLLTSGHFSPFEHCCQATWSLGHHANLRGFQSYRLTLPAENGKRVSRLDPKALLAELTCPRSA